MGTYVGVDVGKSGAIAIICDDFTPASIEIIDFNSENRIINTLLSLAYDIDYTCIEKVASMHGQGVKSMFSFGENYGWWQGVMAAIGIGYELVRPQEWMKGMGLPKDKGQRKKAIHNTAKRLYPQANLTGARGGMKDGRSDALMIAHYARKTYGGQSER